MKGYDNNAATQLVEGRLFLYDFEAKDCPGKADIEKLNTITNFYEYVLRYAMLCGYSEDTGDTGKLASFLGAKCKEAGVKISRQTLLNWLTNGLPANTESGRENVYRLCFALQLDGQQTREFFLKAFLERPFNYKDIHEAVYFFCMNNNLGYADAVRIIAKIEAEDITPNPYADNITEQIGEHLGGIKTEEEFLRYINENRSGFAVPNQTATERIEQLVDSCMAIASKEYAISYIDDNEIRVNNIDELLNVIYGYSARATVDAKPIYQKSINKSNFPDLIKRNWPQREQFAQILNKKTASYDTIRRALIMLAFYDFFANAIVMEKEAQKARRKTGQAVFAPAVATGLFDEFETELNTLLSECGYVQLYWRNPFDWMIGYCAMSVNPLDTLRDLIEEYYLSDPTVQNQ